MLLTTAMSCAPPPPAGYVRESPDAWTTLNLFLGGLPSLAIQLAQEGGTTAEALVRLAAAWHGALWAAWPAEAAGDAEVEQWLGRWLEAMPAIPWNRSGAALAGRSREQLLAQLNGAAAWLLRQRQRSPAAGWPARSGMPPEPALAPGQVLCMVAVSLLSARGCTAVELVLAAEGSALAAAAVLARLEAGPAGGSGLGGNGEGDSALFSSLEALKQLYSAVATACKVEQAPRELASVPGGVESLMGAAEAAQRLAAVLVQ